MRAPLVTAAPALQITIVSLLGREPGGVSEFSSYSFAGGFESPIQRMVRFCGGLGGTPRRSG
jgi:hypothetical protein